MARDIAAECRQVELDEVPPISLSWVAFFRQRHRFTKLRQGSTDRPNSTVADLQADNAWRAQLLDVCQHPAEYGLTGCDTIPKEFLLGLDETPLPYGVRLRTYDVSNARGTLIVGYSFLLGPPLTLFSLSGPKRREWSQAHL